jgi:hypothetical protein
MKFDAEIEAPGNDDDEGDSSNSLSTLRNDFESMANILVDLGQQDDSEDDDMFPETQPTLTPSPQSATAAFHDASRRVPAYKKIPLEILFNCPAVGTPESNPEFFFGVWGAQVWMQKIWGWRLNRGAVWKQF